MPIVIETYSQELADAFAGVDCVALDVEGVDLGRSGQISLVQLAAPSRCFLLDLLGKEKGDPLVTWLKCLLENAGVKKIVHDCRMDSDALGHILGICLVNVHDTSCWHHAVRGVQNCGLNDLLEQNGLRSNVLRDSSVYAKNHAFWAKRPLTKTMIAWASGDVALLFEVMRRQIADASGMQASRAERLSAENVSAAKSAHFGTVTVRNIGAFIGHRGSNIRALQMATSTLMYPRGVRSDGRFAVYYHDEASFARVKAAAA